MNERTTIKAGLVAGGAMLGFGLATLVTGPETKMVSVAETTRATIPALPSSPKIATIQASESTHSGSATIEPPEILSVSFTEAVEAPAYQIPTSGIKLVWNASPDTNVVGYRVYFAKTTENTYQSANVGTQTVAQINGLTAGVDYRFFCVSFNEYGMESLESNSVTGRPPIKVYLAYDRMAVSSFGKLGSTNHLQMSSNLINWSNVFKFYGDGNLKVYHHTNNQHKAFFRTKAI
jgi:hypothetical protein